MNTILVEQTPSGKYVLRYNASLLKESNCHRKVWFTLFQGLVPANGDKDFKMDYGTAFHRAMRAHYSNRSLDECVRVAVDYYSQSTIPDSDWHSISHLINCVMQYVSYYKKEGDLLVPDMGSDGQPMLEIPFEYPFLSTPNTDVLLCGTMDFKGKFAGQFDVVIDHKTTSILQKQSYLDSYISSPQLMTYKMIYEILFPGQPVHCMINGIFLKSSNKNEFQRSGLIDFTPHQMAQHRRHLESKIRDVVDRFEEWLHFKNEEKLDELFGENYTCCQQQYGMCQYLPLCLAPSPEDREMLINNEYAKRIYDPSKFQA